MKYIVLTKTQVDALSLRKQNYLSILKKRKVDFRPTLLADGITYVIPLSVIESGEFIELYKELETEGLTTNLIIKELTENDFPKTTE